MGRQAIWTATRETKAAAVAWAASKETELRAIKRGAFPTKTLADALHQYAERISPTKKGARFELLRLSAFERNFPKLSAKRIAEVTTADLAQWRDARLAEVTRGSVQRDINLLSNVFTVAANEWKWLHVSPFKGLRAPGENPPRDRRISPSEIKRICRWLGYFTGAVPTTKQEQVALSFMIALRTGMRAAELLSLGDDTVNLTRRVATVEHKMQYRTGKPREVPLSTQSVRLLRPQMGRGPIFDVSAGVHSALFHKACKALLIDNLHFHDSRAEALTRLSTRVDVMQLARISGHKDLRILMEHYYRTTADEIALRLG